MRLNERYMPQVLCNGDTHAELLTRSRFLLMKSRDKWSESQKKRGELLFKLYPKIKEAYNLINSLRCVFRNKKLDKDSAKKKLHEWYQKVSDSTLRKVKSARDTIKSRQDEVLNYFLNFSTNASAESLILCAGRFCAFLFGYESNDSRTICHPELVEGSLLLLYSAALCQESRFFDFAQDDR